MPKVDLDKDRVYAIGIKIGRQSTEMVLPAIIDVNTNYYKTKISGEN